MRCIIKKDNFKSLFATATGVESGRNVEVTRVAGDLEEENNNNLA